ncbi:MAG TPA: hypothetical protein VFB14_14145 [Bryobacteraceae bacterium]|nr:hypothetical protein [Bryobacteraceae bacterium]
MPAGAITRAFAACKTRRLKAGIGVYWRDALTHESGALGILPFDAGMETYASLVEAMREWREESVC